MDIAQILEWLSKNKEAIGALVGIVTIIGTLIGWKKSQKSDPNPTTTTTNTTNYSSQGNQTIASITASDSAVIQGNHFGEIHNHYGYDDEKVAQLAAKLAQEFRKEDTETIKALEATVKALTEQPANQPGIKEALDMLSQGKTELAENIFARIALEAKQKGKEAQLEEAAALRHIGSLAFLHDTQKALTSYQRSTELDPDNKNGWNQLGSLYHRIGELEKSENACMTVLKLAGTDQEDQATAYGNLGIVYQTRGDLDQAAESLQKALGLNEALGVKEGMASQYGNLGIVYQTRGDLDQALEYYQKSLAIEIELECKEGMASQYGNLGLVYQTRGELDQAVEYWQKSLAIFTEVGMKPDMAQMQSWLDEVNPKKAE